MLHSLRSLTTTRGFSFQSSIIDLQQLLNDNYVIYLTVSYVNVTHLYDNEGRLQFRGPHERKWRRNILFSLGTHPLQFSCIFVQEN